MTPSFTMSEGGFGVGDYVVFGVLCAASCAGGVWYSAIGSRSKAVVDIKDYLLGGRSMSTFPVAMSLIASYVSGVTILGTPAEIYNYGTQYWLVIIGVSLSCAVVATIYLPVFCTLRLSSSYEYLELRFNRHVRAAASVLFLLDEVLFLPMVVFVPALAFNQLTGFSVFAVAGAMVIICGLYTVLGGLKAVVWTDSVQTGIMFIGVVLVAAAGTIAVGGVREVLDIANESGRLELSNWSFSPYERQTGWGAVVGGFLYWTCFNSVNQTMVQRYIALPSKRKAIAALGIFCIGAILAISLCVWCGLTAWGAWVLGGCDPGGVPLVDDRLLPAFVTYVSKLQHLPGLAGVFLAGVFGAGLSSLSAVLNACALVAVEDIMHGWLQLKLKPMTEGILARAITGTLAVISVIMLFVIQKLGGVLGVATALSAIAASATCGVFTLGMVCWWVGPAGALSGAAAGAILAGTVSLGTQAAAARGLRAPPLNLTMECARNASFVGLENTIDPETIFPLFRVSYHWIAPLGLITTLLVGMVVGYFFDKPSSLKMDAELFTPVMWRWLPSEARDKAGDTRRARASLDAATPHSAPLILATVDKIEMNGVTSR
ncbi:sodium-coupled monocarboxylate transporter 1-like isoform X1 [Trichoplusia ni]|uniref:Sodium-coupled monocarboxylate transporter 1-like isoform X1 n=1 Tax=Trichoplusia ni TaxID=7111 RepID=A0A7E5WCF7_TRINI|nr:sodium-coupled monocarboxylate transporter 1-like isoform X1 [Trichoplusia ni]XP_026737842.1 sodium-coupled monocarboxylate transporter 1-like isoform X1 [Trichoplusia ni]